MRLRPASLPLLALLACAVGPFDPFDRAREADRPYTAGLARVESVEVEVQGASPVGAWVWVRGELPDPCTALDSPYVRRSGSIFEVELATRRPFGASCEPLPTRFERRIRLGVDESISGAYIVTVNGVSQSFAVHVRDPAPLF